jgi:hypothetical protein
MAFCSSFVRILLLIQYTSCTVNLDFEGTMFIQVHKQQL